MTFDYSFDPATGHLTIAEGSTMIPSRAFYWDEYDDPISLRVKSVSIPDSVTSAE